MEWRNLWLVFQKDENTVAASGGFFWLFLEVTVAWIIERGVHYSNPKTRVTHPSLHGTIPQNNKILLKKQSNRPKNLTSIFFRVICCSCPYCCCGAPSLLRRVHFFLCVLWGGGTLPSSFLPYINAIGGSEEDWGGGNIIITKSISIERRSLYVYPHI